MRDSSDIKTTIRTKIAKVYYLRGDALSLQPSSFLDTGEAELGRSLGMYKN